MFETTRLEIEKIKVKNILQTFYVSWTFSYTGRTLLEQMRTLNVNITGRPDHFTGRIFNYPTPGITADELKKKSWILFPFYRFLKILLH